MSGGLLSLISQPAALYHEAYLSMSNESSASGSSDKPREIELLEFGIRAESKLGGSAAEIAAKYQRAFHYLFDQQVGPTIHTPVDLAASKILLHKVDEALLKWIIDTLGTT